MSEVPSKIEKGSRVINTLDQRKGEVIDPQVPFEILGPQGVCSIAVNYDGEEFTSFEHPSVLRIE
jgi:hypothetical protein